MGETVTREAGRPWHILLVEDDPDDAELIQLALSDADFFAEFTRVETGAQMRTALEGERIDAILSDYAIPGFGGREALEIMQERGLDIPFIIISGEIGENTAVALMKAGVHDYISKQNLTRLAPAIERELRDCAIRLARRQAEQALRESEQRHATLIQSIHGIVWEALQLPGVYTFVSPQAEQLLGYPSQRWLEDADFWHTSIYGEDRTRVVQEYQNAIARGRPFQLEYRRTTTQGGMLWLRDVVSLVETSEGQSILRGVTFDVTERRAAEDERERLLRITEQRAREMSTIAAISAALRTATSRQETLKIVMESLQQLLPFQALAYHTFQDGKLGLPERVQGEWPGATLEQLTRDPDMPKLLEAAFESVTLPKIGDQATHFEGHLLALPLRAQGRLLGVILGHYHLPVHNGNANMPLSTPQTRLLTALADIIAGAIYRAELYEETIIMARQMAEMTTSTPQGLVLLDGTGRIILANPAGQDAVAALAPHAPTGPITRLADRPLNLAAPTRDQAGDARFEVISQGPEPRTFEVFLRPVDTDFAHQSWVLILTDVTAERIEQRRLQEQNRLAAVGQLAAGIAHDFNNSLGVIRLYTDLVMNHADLSERDRVRLQTVSKQIGHATHLIHQILDFSRRSIIQKRIVDLHREVEEILAMLEHTLGKNIDLVFEHDEPPLLVDADKTRLQQAILNLAVNARDAMPNGGQLLFELRQSSDRAIDDARLTDMAPGQWVTLTITDTGHGIEAHHLSQLFEPFFTTKPAGHGTGLGLAQVYGIVKQHNGYITVNTQLGKGTVFTLYFPLQTTAEVPETAPQPLIQTISQKHILVVEDDPAGRDALRDTLQEYGYRITTAENGLDALNKVQANKASFDLILTDMVMPKMSGIQFLHQLRQNKVKIPTILFTGYPLADGGQELLEAGIVDWLPKPFNADILLQKIETALAAHGKA